MFPPFLFQEGVSSFLPKGAEKHGDDILHLLSCFWHFFGVTQCGLAAGQNQRFALGLVTNRSDHAERTCFVRQSTAELAMFGGIAVCSCHTVRTKYYVCWWLKSKSVMRFPVYRMLFSSFYREYVLQGHNSEQVENRLVSLSTFHVFFVFAK